MPQDGFLTEGGFLRQPFLRAPEGTLTGSGAHGIGVPPRRSVNYAITQKQKDRLDEIRYRQQLSDEHRRFFAEKAISNQYLYDNVVEEVGDYFSNVAVPWPFIITQTYVGRAFLELCQDTPYFEVMEDRDTLRGPAKRVQRTLNRELYLQDFPFTALMTYKNVFVRGTEWVGYIPWSTYKNIEMPILYSPNWFRVWVNPNVIDLTDDDAYFIHETYMRHDTLINAYGGNPYWDQKALRAIEPIGESPSNMMEDRSRSILGIPNKRFDPYSQLVKLTWYWTPRELVVSANDSIVLRDTRGKDHPTDGKIPFRDVWIIPDDRSIYKPSLLDFGKDLFAEVNEKRNQRIDATNLILNPTYALGAGSTLSGNKIPTMPGYVVKIGGPVDQLKPLPVDWRILPASLNEEGKSEQDIMRYSSAFEPMRGEPGKGRPTATGDIIQEKRGAQQSDVYNFLLNLMTVERVAHDFIEFHQMYMNGPSGLKDSQDKDDPYAFPEDFDNIYTLRAVGSMLGARDMERRDFLGLMNIIFGSPVLAQGAMQKVPEWISRAMDYFKIRSPNDLYEGVENFEPIPMQELMEIGAFGGAGGGRSQGPGMIPGGMPKPKTQLGSAG